MMRCVRRSRWVRVWAACGSLLVLGECGLSDQQLAAIAESVITTGLNTIVTQLLATLISTAAGGAA